MPEKKEEKKRRSKQSDGKKIASKQKQQRDRSFFPSRKQWRDTRLQNRMKICALAIVLMWASSLRTAAFIASFVMEVPDASLVFESCKSAVQVSNEERKKFTHCVDVQASQCEINLDTAIFHEEERVNEATQRNTDIINHGERLSDECASDYSSVRRALERWVNAPGGQFLPVDDNVCTTKETELMLGSLIDVDRVKSEAIAISTDFGEESLLVVGNMIAYAQLRIAYDRNYLYNHTKITVPEYFDIMKVPPFDIEREIGIAIDTFEYVYNCTTLDPRAVCPFRPFNALNLLERYKAEQLKNLEEFMDVLTYEYEVVEEGLQAFFRRVDNAYETVEKFYNGVKRTKDWLSGRGRRENDPIFDWDINVFKVRRPTFPTLRYPYSLMDDLEELFGRDLFADSYLRHDEIFGAFLNNKDKILEAYNGWKLEIDKMYNASNILDTITPDDYDPPQYKSIYGKKSNFDGEDEKFEKITKEFMNQSAEALDTFANAQSANETSNVTKSLPKLNFTAVKTTFSNFDINFERLKAPSIDFNLWFLEIANIGDFAFLVDYVFRIYFTIRLCFKYWDAGYIKLPQADVRTQKEIKNPFKQSNGRLIINIMTNPLIGAIFAGSIAIWAVGLITSAYLPLYSEYRSGCIPNGGNGTFVSENLYSSAYNFAYREGSSSMIKRVDKVELERTDTCSVNTVSSTTKQNDDAAMLANYMSSIQVAQSPMGLYERCIDMEVADAQFKIACCNQTGYDTCPNSGQLPYVCPFNDLLVPPLPFSPPSEYLSRRTCNVDFEDPFWQLSDAIFDCTTLPSCDITCKSPNKNKLRKVTKECGCITEWLLHSLWLRSLMSLMIFIIMNVSRVVFVDGIARVTWRRLHPGTYTVLATSDESGGIITKDHTNSQSGSSKKHSSRDDHVCTVGSIKGKIDRNTKLFELGGWTKVIGALLSNVFWIVIVFRTFITTALQPEL